MHDLVAILVPIACGCVLPIMIVWFSIRESMNKTNQRTKIVLAAIEKNPDLDIEELMEKISPKKKLLKEKLLSKLQTGNITTLLGIGFLVCALYADYMGGMNSKDLRMLYLAGIILLVVGGAFLRNYFVGITGREQVTREAFITQIEREQEALRSFLLALCCGNKSDADDLAQDAIVKAYLSSAGYQEQGKFRSWLFKIAHNTFLNHRASCRTMETLDDARTLISSTTADNAFEHQELYLALRTLPPKERSAITLFYLSGYSIKEVAVITETSEDAVKKQLSRGRDKLRQELRMDD